MMLNGSSDEKLRVVIDTSVYVAAALTTGLAEEVVLAGDRGIFVSFTSEEILAELEKTLRRLKISKDKIELVIGRTRYITQVVTPEKTTLTKLRSSLRDPNDAIIIACAAAADANIIISLDKDLLDLKTYGPVAILHPRTFRWIIPEK